MESIHLRRGGVVRIGSLWDATTLYVAVEGGFDIAPVLGSVSTYIRGGIGGWHGRALVAGDLLPLVRNTATEHDELRLEGLDLSAPERFPVITGPQGDYFSDSALAKFFGTPYEPFKADRVQVTHLDGVNHLLGYNIASDAIAPDLSRCRATASLSCCWRIVRPPAATRRSPLSFPRICPRSAVFQSAQRLPSNR
jgi:allophanate hydrolase